MPIQAIDSDRLYRRIARQLSDLMARGEFKPGERLPAERELAQKFRVSRPSVREALIALEIEGKVEVRVGSGVYVTKPRPPPVRGVLQGEGPFELIRARRVVEGETAALAARNATEEEIEEIEEAVKDLKDAVDRKTDDPDRRFHIAIARATRNGPLATIVQLLWDQGRGAVWKQMEKHFQTEELKAETVKDHRAVVEAIRAHDPRAARKAMRTHLAHVERQFGRKMEK